MKLLLALYFFVFAIIQAGLFFGVNHYYRSQPSVRPSPYWMNSLLVSVAALFIFGAGILTVDDIAKPQFNFTIPNTLFVVAAVLQGMFCKSLNGSISQKLKVILLILVTIFGLVFEWLRVHSTFEVRTLFLCIFTSILYGWQIIELRKKRKESPSRQLLYLQYASSAELFFALGRIFILAASTFTIRQVEQLPQLLILITITQFVMNTLSYIAIGGYWAERIAASNAKSEIENQEIKALLHEREKLISSLLKANKTAATGALSASIAHELNQPLGASSLNIQFLQKKLAENNMTPELQAEILETLLNDNQRAANIIRSLRSVFADEKGGLGDVDLGEVINDVLHITHPEILLKQIQIEKRIADRLIVQSNRSEIQQVLLNIVNNAIQALASSQQPHKRIWIEACFTDFGAEISISDNGDGVAPHVQSNLFELLTDSKKKGMGLGLWLCKHIVVRHGGVILFETPSDGGAKFVIKLSLKSAIAQ